MKRLPFKYILLAISVVVLVFTFMAPLRAERAAAIDDMIASDLRMIQDEIDKGSRTLLPNTLADLKLDDALTGRIQKHGIEYEKKTTYKYELCAVFRTDSSSKKDNTVYPGTLTSPTVGTGVIAPGSYEDLSIPSYSYTDFTVHPKGHHCFSLESSGAYRYMNNYESAPSSSTKPALGI
jgi:hypothetical protein